MLRYGSHRSFDRSRRSASRDPARQSAGKSIFNEAESLTRLRHASGLKPREAEPTSQPDLFGKLSP
jgi:hypothetical protein